MNRKEFFDSINNICAWDKIGDDDEVISPLITYLSQQTDEEIFSFDEIMAELLYELDTKKNFKNRCLPFHRIRRDLPCDIRK